MTALTRNPLGLKGLADGLTDTGAGVRDSQFGGVFRETADALR